jgi:hypothetical protein
MIKLMSYSSFNITILFFSEKSLGLESRIYNHKQINGGGWSDGND